MTNTAFLPIDDTNFKTCFNLDRDRKTAQRKIAPRKRAHEQIPFGLRLWLGLGKGAILRGAIFQGQFSVYQFMHAKNQI